MPNQLQENILSTYFWLRGGIVGLSAALPVILFGGGRLAGLPLQTSMSAYYGADYGLMRNWFAGILWAIGSFLFLYKGFSDVEDIALNFAGAFAIAVPMIPCNCWEGAGPGSLAHVVSAVAFFLSMAFVCFKCAGDTLPLLPTERMRKTFKQRYWGIGVLLIVSPLVAVIVAVALNQNASYTFFAEAFGVWVFAYYWWTKSREFRISSAEKLAAHGHLEHRQGIGVVRVDPVAQS